MIPLAMAAAGWLPGPGCVRAPPDPPAPVTVDAPDGSAGAIESSWAGPRYHPIRWYGWPPRSPPVPDKPWLSPTLSVSPERPAEGTAVGVRITLPSNGRDPLSVGVELAGRAVPLARTETGWFGIGALAIGSAGRQLLVARFAIRPDSVVELILPVAVESRAFPATRLSVAARFSNPPPDVMERIREERELIQGVLARATPEWLAGGGFEWPRPPRFTSPFGQRRVFNGELQSRHWGLDLEGQEGVLVRASAAGRVSLAGAFYYQGNAVYVDHGLGVYTGYFHLSQIDVKDGDRVQVGQVLGRVGATGRVTGPHLHWTLHVGSVSVDPSSLLKLENLPDAGGVPERGATGR